MEEVKLGEKEKSTLIICGDYMEDLEIIVPFIVLQSFGVRVDCVSPNKKAGQECITAVHDYMGYELYTELQGHPFTLNSNFEEINPESYDALVIPGGRFTEELSVDERVLTIVRRFAEAGKAIATTCHSQLVLASAGVLKGNKCTAFPSLKPIIEMAGGIWWARPDDNPLGLDLTAAVEDANLISAIGWPAHAHYLRLLIQSMGGRILTPKSPHVLFLCADYVDDYEITVPFRALESLGCKVDAVSPNKKRGESCVTAIYDEVVGGKERRGHNFLVTANWNEIGLNEYDCIIVPGGRSPELLVMDPKVVSFVKDFALLDDKLVAAIGNGTWLLAAAGLVKDRRCAGSNGMKAIIKIGGGQVVESCECVAHGNLLTATGWPALPTFISQLSNLLHLSVLF